MENKKLELTDNKVLVTDLFLKTQTMIFTKYK